SQSASPPPITPASALPSPVAPENQPIAAAVDAPPGGRATSTASCAVVATDQPTPFSTISSVNASEPCTNGTSANAAADSAPPATRKTPPSRAEYSSPTGRRAASDAIAYVLTIAPTAAGPQCACRFRYTGTRIWSALEPAT